MALPKFPTPVDYELQQNAFEDFLQSYKTTDALEVTEESHLDVDGTSDEYDFMDDVVDAGGNSRPRGRRDPKHKYMDLLQNIADRRQDHIYIDLDDLDEVSKWRFRCGLRD